jgi:hypothetical protein
MRLLDPRFHYVPVAQTDVLATWRRFGYRPMTDCERRARQRAAAPANERVGTLVRDLALTAGDAVAADGHRKPDLNLAG